MEGDNSNEGYHQNRKLNLKQRTAEEVRGIIKLCSLESGDRVLDCPSGYGRHSIGLAKSGMNVVGCDINSYELKLAKKGAMEARVEVEFIKTNMLDLKYRNEFDATINMWYSFGFFNKDSENFRVLKNFYNATKIGGVFLMHTDVNLPRFTSSKAREYEKRSLSGGGYLRQVEFYNSKTRRNYGVWIIEKEGRVEMRDYSVRVYSKEEFVAMCKKVGFKDVKVYSSWSGKKYVPTSVDMIVVAKK
jgi:ubiquinone/menaquinone biosynthesis C-methylase UbiE